MVDAVGQDHAARILRGSSAAAGATERVPGAPRGRRAPRLPAASVLPCAADHVAVRGFRPGPAPRAPAGQRLAPAGAAGDPSTTARRPARERGRRTTRTGADGLAAADSDPARDPSAEGGAGGDRRGGARQRRDVRQRGRAGIGAGRGWSESGRGMRRSQPDFDRSDAARPTSCWSCSKAEHVVGLEVVGDPPSCRAAKIVRVDDRRCRRSRSRGVRSASVAHGLARARRP